MTEKLLMRTADRAEWRVWLSENFESAREIWFVFPTKDSGEAGVSYNDAVEEALCFGWIDSTAGKLDDTHGLRRFTKRRPGASYSRPNIERLAWLYPRGMIHEKILPSVLPLIEAPYVFPEDIIAVLKADKETYQNYLSFSESYRRIRVDYIDAARERPEEFQKRLKTFVDKTKAGKRIMGFGGIDKYY